MLPSMHQSATEAFALSMITMRKANFVHPSNVPHLLSKQIPASKVVKALIKAFAL